MNKVILCLDLIIWMNFKETDRKVVLSIKKEMVEQTEMKKLCMGLKSQLAAKEISLMDINKKLVSDKFSEKIKMPKNSLNNLQKNVKDLILQMKIKQYKL